MSTTDISLNGLSLDDHLENMVCNICSRQLNVCPIFFSEKFGDICGRCCAGDGFNELQPLLRQHTYEKLIAKLTFSCTNKTYGCDEVVKFDEIQKHEKSCKFQCINCPLYSKQFSPNAQCLWIGNSKLMGDHLKIHRDQFFDPPQFHWPKDGENMIFFTTVGNQIVTVVIKHENESKFACVVMLNGSDLESQCFRYQLELSDNDNKNNSLLLRRNRLEQLSGFPENLRFPDMALEIDILQISRMLQYPERVYARLSIVKKHKKEVAQITGNDNGDLTIGGFAVTLNKQRNEPPDEDMLSELECPVCNEFMVPPIFICSIGHSICDKCHSLVAECPNCRTTLGQSRNFTLERLTLKVKYPCKNREIGCGFVTTSDKIKQHQSVCELSENHCILKCGWRGLSPGLYNHFLANHATQLIQHNVSIFKDVKHDKNTGHYFLYVMGEMFCLSLKNCAKFLVKFNMQHVGHFDSRPRYKYAINFAASQQTGSPNLCFTNYCQNWNPNLAEAVGPGAVNIPGEIMKMYIYQNKSYYITVHIFKVIYDDDD
ncbi:unnamed protein product [Ceutorhynchus assimilis]|uniref:RING-type E3 ubiquitin transferase n=1 Tax=Ceutorhynchus assimilis TaxID=467358 RepID=A0A9N9MTF3_9CUCU|nr:unnamed protein product [Ceutorhynchus assimilis]